jgi:DNA-binding response OmpR family regulator
MMPTLSPARQADDRAGKTYPLVLIADADPGVRRHLGRCLYREGFNVAIAADAEDVLERVRLDPERYAIVLIDAHLPGASSPRVVAELRSSAPWTHCCVMTASPDEDVTDWVDAGAAWVFPKPFPVRAVTEVLWLLAAAPS